MFDQLLQAFCPGYQMYSARSCYCASTSRRGTPSVYFSSSHKRGLHLPCYSLRRGSRQCAFISRKGAKSTVIYCGIPGWRHPRSFHLNKFRQRKFRVHSSTLEVATAIDVINDLGLDTLTFLMVTVIVVPAFRLLKASPVS